MSSSSNDKSNDRVNKVAPEDKNISWFFLPFKIVNRIIGYVVFSAMISIVVEIVGLNVDFMWKSNPDHAKTTLVTEINYLGNFTQSSLGVPPKEFAQKIVMFMYNHVNITNDSNNNDNGYSLRRGLNRFTHWLQQYIDAALFVIMDIVLRCLIICLSAGLFVIFGITSVVDGFVERELRKEGAGQEYGYLYHHIKRFVPKVLVMAPITYLAWPTAINPSYILVPAAWLFGQSLYQLTSKFMKM